MQKHFPLLYNAYNCNLLSLLVYTIRYSLVYKSFTEVYYYLDNKPIILISINLFYLDKLKYRDNRTPLKSTSTEFSCVKNRPVESSGRLKVNQYRGFS